jgi:hypothetical protein
VLDIHAAADSQGRRRLAFQVIGRQLLFLRQRSLAKTTAFYEQPPGGGYARPRVG